MEPIVEQLGKFFLTIDDELYSSNKEYPILTLVEDGGKYYVSRKDVPAGVNINNTEYWKPYNISSNPFGFKTETNINNMLETGFYWGNTGRPEGSDENETYHVSVKAADYKDNNGKYSIEQILYSIKYHNKIFVRVGFTTDKTNPDLVEWEDFQQITNWFVDKSGTNANSDINNGFYGYVADNIPSDATQWGSLAVRRADKPDGANFTSIEQIFYGRGSDDGKVWFRLGFYNNSTYEWGKWTSNSITYDLSNIANRGYATPNEFNEIMSLYNSNNFTLSITQDVSSEKLLLTKSNFQTIKNGEAVINKAFCADIVGYTDTNELFSTRNYMYFGEYDTINNRYPIITVDIDYPVTLVP